MEGHPPALPLEAGPVFFPAADEIVDCLINYKATIAKCSWWNLGGGCKGFTVKFFKKFVKIEGSRKMTQTFCSLSNSFSFLVKDFKRLNLESLCDAAALILCLLCGDPSWSRSPFQWHTTGGTLHCVTSHGSWQRLPAQEAVSENT